MLFAGRLIARFGGRAVLSVFSLALIPVLPMVVFSPNLWLLALFMAVFGAMAGCMDVAMNAQAVEIERKLDRAIMSSSPRVLEPWGLCRRLGGQLCDRLLGVRGAVAADGSRGGRAGGLGDALPVAGRASACAR